MCMEQEECIRVIYPESFVEGVDNMMKSPGSASYNFPG